MKHDYDSMSDDEIHELYFEQFGTFFQVVFGDYDPHREEMIACIESGIPQDEDVYWAKVPDVPEGVTY